jgi:hypothetical protein
MRKFWGAALLTLTALGQASALDAEAAKQFLFGAWTAPGETWVFSEDGRWSQFIGGKTTETTFATEAMPENLFALISGASGRRYVVHTTTIPGLMTVYPENETRAIGTFTRRSD